MDIGFIASFEKGTANPKNQSDDGSMVRRNIISVAKKISKTSSVGTGYKE